MQIVTITPTRNADALVLWRRIAMNNEKENVDKVESYFERAGLPTPDRWDMNDVMCSATWNKASSEELFEYMEGPIVGYEYKWPESVK